MQGIPESAKILRDHFVCTWVCVSVSVRVSVCVAFNRASDAGLGLNTQCVISNMHYSGNVRYSSKTPVVQALSDPRSRLFTEFTIDF